MHWKCGYSTRTDAAEIGWDGERCMSAVRLVYVSSALLLSLGACGGGGGTPPPSYTLTAAALNPATVTAGNMSSSLITVTSVNGYFGSVSLSCSIVSGGTPSRSCALSASAVTVSGATPGTSTLTVSTTTSTPGGNYAFSVAAIDGN